MYINKVTKWYVFRLRIGLQIQPPLFPQPPVDLNGRGMMLKTHSLFEKSEVQPFLEGGEGGGGGGGLLSSKNDGGARRTFSKNTLKGTSVLFDGRGSNGFLPLWDTNSKTTFILFGILTVVILNLAPQAEQIYISDP